MCKKRRLICFLMQLVMLLTGCAASINEQEKTQESEIPFDSALPDTIRTDENGIPVMDVYITGEERVEEMDIETYLCGVLAGEMKNNWPMEALKAQAILARTFVIKFLSEKQSKYENADISTDVEEAQAYNAEAVNDRIRQAVNETRGQIVCYENEPIYAWFHSHAGGKTANAQEGLSYKDEASYTQSVRSIESADADAETQAWTTTFAAEEVINAAQECGVKIEDKLHSAAMGAMGESGRVRTIRLNGYDVPANELRIALGSTKMRSTMINSISLWDGKVTIKGTGYGHGVGMSQWGAYEMAKQGKTAREIIAHYFKNVDIVQKWR